MAKNLPNFQWSNPQTGMLTPQALAWLRENSLETETRFGNVNSGVARAQATADAANNNAANAGSIAAGSALYATADTYTCDGARYGKGVITTNSVTVTPSGGTAPYTFLWTYLEGDTGFVVGPSTTSATVSFDHANAVFGATYQGIWTCTVTDAASATYAVNIGVSAAEVSSGG